MAISRPVTIGQNAEAFTASTITLTTSATVPPGAKVICFVGWGFSTATLSSASDNAALPLTWRVDRQIANGNIHLGLIEADAPQGLPSGTVITATFSAATPDARELGGCYVTGVRAGASFNGTTDITGTTAWTSGSLTPAIGRLFIGGCYGGNTASPTSTAGGNNLEIHDFANAGFSAMTSAWHISASTSSQTVAGTWSVTAGGNASLGSVFLKEEDGWAPARPLLAMLRSPFQRMIPRIGFPLPDIPFPAAAGTTLTPDLLAHTRSIFSPQVNPQLRPALLTHTRSIFTPKVNPTLNPALLTHTRTLFGPKVNSTLKPAMLVHTRAVYAFQLNEVTKPALLTHTRAIYSPQVNPQLRPAMLTHARTIFSPTVAIGAAAILPALLTHTRTIQTPQVNPQLRPALLTHTRTLYTPQVNQRVTVAALTHARTIFTPNVVRVVTPAMLTHTRAIRTPALNVRLSVPMLTHSSRQVYEPFVANTLTPAGVMLWRPDHGGKHDR